MCSGVRECFFFAESLPSGKACVVTLMCNFAIGKTDANEKRYKRESCRSIFPTGMMFHYQHRVNISIAHELYATICVTVRTRKRRNPNGIHYLQ